MSDDWFFTGTIDFEYKKYVLLAYLQEVDSSFSQTRLYPHLAQLVRQYHNLLTFIRSKETMQQQFPEDLKGFDPEKFRLVYQQVLEDDELMEELEKIVTFSRDRVKEYLENGKEIYEFLERHIDLSTVGVVPLQQERGLMMFRNGQQQEVNVYRYEVGFYTSSGDKYRTLATRRIWTSTTTSPLRIKEEVLKAFNFAETLAVFLFESTFEIPLQHTYLPIAKRMLARQVA